MNPPEKITVLIAEDHVVGRQGLCALLDAGSRFRVAGQAQTGREAVILAAQLGPDVILVDKLNLHETAGLTRYAITTGLIESNSRRAVS